MEGSSDMGNHSGIIMDTGRGNVHKRFDSNRRLLLQTHVYGHGYRSVDDCDEVGIRKAHLSCSLQWTVQAHVQLRQVGSGQGYRAHGDTNTGK